MQSREEIRRSVVELLTELVTEHGFAEDGEFTRQDVEDITRDLERMNREEAVQVQAQKDRLQKRADGWT